MNRVQQNTIIEDGKNLLPKFVPSVVEVGGGRKIVAFDSQEQPKKDEKLSAVFVHGFPDNATSFRLVAQILVESGRRCLILSCPGYDTTSASSFSSATAAAIASDYDIAIQTILGKGARFHLVGHDWGSTHASCLARKKMTDDENVVVSLVMASVPHGMSGGIRAFPEQVKNFWYIAFFQLPFLPELWLRRGGGLKCLWKRWSPNFDFDGQTKYFESVCRSLLQQEGVLRCALQMYREVVGISFLINFVIMQLVFGIRWLVGLGNQPFHLSDKLSTKEEIEENDQYFTMPVMGIVGEMDGCIDPRLFEYSMATASAELNNEGTYRSGCKLVKIPDAGHFLFSEKPEAVAASLKQFMAESDGTKS